MIPPFEPGTGNLPPGIHEADWDELAERFGWTAHRRTLLGGLRELAGVLASFGCTQLWVDGSFVTAKEDPADYDACWDMADVDWREVEHAEPCIFDLNGDRGSQKARFGGAIWPAHIVPDETPERTMLENFQRDRQDRRKGIVRLRLPLAGAARCGSF